MCQVNLPALEKPKKIMVESSNFCCFFIGYFHEIFVITLFTNHFELVHLMEWNNITI